MNILYLTFLDGNKYAGPTYSVPKQIEAQSRYDNVFWYNLLISENKEWKNLEYYHDIEEYKKGIVKSLPEPFNHPDLIIVEQFYDSLKTKIPYELIRGNSSYIIIPRGELTHDAQKRKKIKKEIANFLIMYRFARAATAIQYLTDNEKNESGEKWNKKSYVIPNGIDLPLIEKNRNRSQKKIRCVAIGRISSFHKGLDLLIDACSEIKDQLSNANCTITIYGPDVDGEVNELNKRIVEKKLNDIVFLKEAVFGKEKERVLTENDVFIITSRFEGHPMAMIEALSYGLPCIATSGSNMREEIDKNNAGWTADNNSISIKNALLRMLSEQEQIEMKGSNAIRLASAYDWDSIAMKSHRLYFEKYQ